MAEVEELKKLRSVSKRKLTIVLNKLKSSLQYGDPEFKTHYLSSVTEYENLVDINLQIIEIENNDNNYLDDITTNYDSVLKLYFSSIKEDQAIKIIQKLKQISEIVEQAIVNLEPVLKSSKDILTKTTDEMTKKDFIQLELNISIISNEIKEFNSEVENANSIASSSQDISELKNKVSNVISICKRIITDSRLAMALIKDNEESDNSTPISKSLLSPLKSPRPEVLKSPFSDKISETITTQFATTSVNLKPEADPFVPSGHMDQVNSIYSTNTRPSFKVEPAIATVSVSQGVSDSHLTSHLGIPHPLPPFSTHYNTRPSYKVEPSIGPVSQGLSSLTMADSHLTSHLGIPPPLPHFSPHYAQQSVVQTKRPSLPYFSGERADWPEFRCVWRKLAEAQYSNQTQLAMELKRCCKGRAAERLKFIYCTNESAYEELWSRLYEEYDDPALSIQEALGRLMSIKAVGEDNYLGLVQMIDTVEGVHSQLRELEQLHAVHAVDVDRITQNLPRSIQVEWFRRYRDLSSIERVAPFSQFVTFLRGERVAVARLAESSMKGYAKPRDTRPLKGHHVQSHFGSSQAASTSNDSKNMCAIHGPGHSTEHCRTFKAMSLKQRYDALRKAKRCFNCFKHHFREECTAPACSCGKHHHKMLCTTKGEAADDHAPEGEDNEQTPVKDTYLASTGSMALFPICRAILRESAKPVSILLDGGSNASYVTSSCIQKHKLKKLKNVTLDVTTVGGKKTACRSAVYEANLRTTEGRVAQVALFELPKITGKVSPVSRQVITTLFPDFDPEVLMRNDSDIDILLGTDFYGLHPKEELANIGENLSVMQGKLGICVVGTHPLLKESTEIEREVPRTVHGTSTHLINAVVQPEFCILQPERLDSAQALTKETNTVNNHSTINDFVSTSSSIEHVKDDNNVQQVVVNVATQTSDTPLVHSCKLQSEIDANDCAPHEQCHNIEKIGVPSVVTGKVTASISPSVMIESYETISEMASHTGAMSTVVNDNNGSHHSDVAHSENLVGVTNLDINKVKHSVFFEENNLHKRSMLVDEVANNTSNHDNDTPQKGGRKKKRSPSLVLYILKLLSHPLLMVTFFLINILYCAMIPFRFACGQVKKCRINTVLNGSVELLNDDVSPDVREMPFSFLEYQDKDNPIENNLGSIPNCTLELSSKAQASIPGDY